MLAEIQTVRRIGWSNTLANIIQEKQNEETHRMEGFRWNIVWQNVIQNLPWALAPALTFSVYTSQGNSLDITNALTSLSIITLLTNPASKLLSAIPSTAASVGCFDRIQNFLLIPSCQGGLGLQSADVENQQDNKSLRPHDPGSVQLQQLPSTAIAFNDVTICPAASSSIILQNVNFHIAQGSLTFILGQVGSGKSSLLRAILGHARLEKGRISVSRRDIAYCAQNSWLPNSAIQDAICGFTHEYEHKENLDIKWYEAIIHACALNHDLTLFVDGDRTQIGSSSSTVLSGGQMQRIALARALYSRKKIFLLDDVFSALDNVTKKLIMIRLFGKSGLFRQLNSTAVLVTNESKLENTKPYAFIECSLTTIQPIISHTPARSLFFPTEGWTCQLRTQWVTTNRRIRISFLAGIGPKTLKIPCMMYRDRGHPLKRKQLKYRKKTGSMISSEQRGIELSTSTTYSPLAGRRYSLSSFLLLSTSAVAHLAVCFP